MGLTLNDDRLPQILTRSFSSGGSAGKSPDFEKLKKFFYQYRDWNTRTGLPSDNKIDFLGLRGLFDRN